MKAYSIFDDFGAEASEIIRKNGIILDIHPAGVPRPDAVQMQKLLEEYDCIIIGTSQKISQDMFEKIETPRIIATASVGIDHICIPDEKKHLIRIINTPKANAQSVAEFTMACALSCCKRLAEGSHVYANGKDNKALYRKPEDLFGKTFGVAGAGNISVRIMEFARFFGMNILCWTRNPEKHPEVSALGAKFVSLEELADSADVISVNLPNHRDTQKIISASLIEHMKKNAIFISVSRLATIDLPALLQKAETYPEFYVCADIDPDAEVTKLLSQTGDNVLVTPHIGGGTMETRKRMFRELAEAIAALNS